MRILIGIVLLLMASAPRAAEREAAAIVSKDSVVFHIPVQDLDATWEWNREPKGTVEHEWVIRMPIGRSVGWPFEGTFYVGVVQRSNGPPAANGSASDLIKNSRVVTWVSERGDRSPRDREAYDTFIRPSFRDGVIRVAFYQQLCVEEINRRRPADFRLKGVRVDGSEYNGSVVVTRFRDSREQAARAISGPFTVDEYAIYQTVIDRAFNSAFNSATHYEADLDFFLLNPSTHVGPLKGEEDRIKSFLGVSDDAVRDYLAKRSVSADMSSLAAMGYRVVDADTVHAQREREMREGKRWKRSVRVSVIGFNEARDQALVYVETSSGNLGGMGQVIRLDEINGEWLVTWRVQLWIS